MIIDCDSCVMKHIACDDCVVSFLTDPARAEPAEGDSVGAVTGGVPAARRHEIGEDERTALAVLADGGLVPPLRLWRAETG